LIVVMNQSDLHITEATYLIRNSKYSIVLHSIGWIIFYELLVG